MLCGVMPPTGISGVPFGNTASSAFTTAGEASSAGNNLRPVAPAASAANASVGVITPGRHTRPKRAASATTSALQLGDTISSPPADCTSRTCCGVSTVPAPTSACGKRWRSKAMLSSGSGELSGTSSRLKPAWVIASPTAGASPGVSPRRMATRGACASAAWNFSSGVVIVIDIRFQGWWGRRPVATASACRPAQVASAPSSRTAMPRAFKASA